MRVLNIEEIQARQAINLGAISSEMGLAVGVVPYVFEGDKVAIALHCKTENAPESASLGRAGMQQHRPSPFQLKRVSRSEYTGPVSALVTVGVQDGPIAVVSSYSSRESIPLVFNDGRVEEVCLRSVEDNISLYRSVFNDGACCVFRIGKNHVSVDGVDVPVSMVNAWMRQIDDAAADPRLNIAVGDHFINATVPAAALVKVIYDYVNDIEG